MAGGSGIMIDMIKQSRANAALLKTKSYFDKMKKLRFKPNDSDFPVRKFKEEHREDIKRTIAMMKRSATRNAFYALAASVPVAVLVLWSITYFLKAFYF